VLPKKKKKKKIPHCGICLSIVANIYRLHFLCGWGCWLFLRVFFCHLYFFWELCYHLLIEVFVLLFNFFSFLCILDINPVFTDESRSAGVSSLCNCFLCCAEAFWCDLIWDQLWRHYSLWGRIPSSPGNLGFWS
jgi:hypothetical protein